MDSYEIFNANYTFIPNKKFSCNKATFARKYHKNLFCPVFTNQRKIFSIPFFSSKTDAIASRNISWSLDTSRIIREAKGAIQKGNPEEALKQLYELKDPILDTELSLLFGRLAIFQREKLLGTQTNEETRTSENGQLNAF